MNKRFSKLGVVDFTHCFSLEEAAVFLETTAMTVRKAVAHGKLNALKVGRTLVIKKEDLDAYAATRGKSTAPVALEQTSR